ncbi:MAG TPA: OmpH family outer membrane protein [Spongiibacteraceae bacterium]|nr:OmpH family outer membrane protein [Spongiibacteraceae bacterium]HUH37569.1 OmpH family outer membrane protein [Spongiibacteraceae bacterium]
MLNSIKYLAVVMALVISAGALAEGKVAVLDVDRAILQTQEATKRFKALQDQADFKADRAEFEKLKKLQEDLVKQYQKDLAVMSNDQKEAQRKKIASAQADLEHVGRKLQAAEQEVAQALAQEMAPKLQAVVADIIKSEGIGLLINSKAVMHADTSFNVTAKVTEKLNQAK